MLFNKNKTKNYCLPFRLGSEKLFYENVNFMDRRLGHFVPLFFIGLLNDLFLSSVKFSVTALKKNAEPSHLAGKSHSFVTQ